MIRRYNYTARREIKPGDVRVSIQEAPLRFDATVDIEDYRLPKNAKVFVEAYRQTTWMRFDFGTVGTIRPADDRHLTDFETSEGLLFRLKVTATGDTTGRLLAVADQLRYSVGPQDDPTAESLLPVKPQDLGDEIYRIDYTGTRPLLLVNRQLGDFRSLVRAPQFVSLVYPQVMRDVLSRILLVDQHDADDDAGNWQAQWLRFASRMAGRDSPTQGAGEDLFDDWINEAVASFARTHAMGNRFRLHWRDGGAE
jgi:hypothetical protein